MNYYIAYDTHGIELMIVEARDREQALIVACVSTIGVADVLLFDGAEVCCPVECRDGVVLETLEGVCEGCRLYPWKDVVDHAGGDFALICQLECWGPYKQLFKAGGMYYLV